MSVEPCPCGSKKAFVVCCQPILEAPQKAATAEALMRARYTAHVVKNVDFVVATTHSNTYQPDHHAAIVEWVDSTTWNKLEVLETHKGQASDQEGFVLFRANYEQDGTAKVHEEESYFKREVGRWYFVQGRTPLVKQAPIRHQKIARNAPCPCGSGKKYKRCCG